MKRFLTIVLTTLLVAAANAGTGGETVIDLTYPFSAESVYWPTAEGFRYSVDADGVSEAGFYYRAGSFCGAEHGGTHLDAPVHFSDGMPAVDEIELWRLMAPGVLVDVTEQARRDPDYQVTVADIRRWEEQHGRIPDRSIVLFLTGWGSFYPDLQKYLGTDRRGPEAVPDLHFPGVDPAAATWLVENRQVAAVGLDTASIDRGQSRDFRSHQIFFAAGIPAFENVAHLDRLPPKGFRIVALPMKIQSGSGAPLRIVAVLEGEDSGGVR